MAKQIVAGEKYESITGQLFEIGGQLRQKDGYPYNSEALGRHLQDAIEGKFNQDEPKNEFLKLISGNELLMLDATDGTEILADASDVFAYIDSDFRNWNADEKGPATDAVPVRVYEMTKNGTHAQMFGSLSSDMRKQCLTQAQIKGFIKKYRNWLRGDGYATFFLFKARGHFFVANAFVYSYGKLYVYVYRFGYDRVWDADYRHRFVVPQLA